MDRYFIQTNTCIQIVFLGVGLDKRRTKSDGDGAIGGKDLFLVADRLSLIVYKKQRVVFNKSKMKGFKNRKINQI